MGTIIMIAQLILIPRLKLRNRTLMIVGCAPLLIGALLLIPAKDVATLDIEGELAPFDLRNQLSSNRTQGIPNMIALVKEHAARLAAA